MSKALENSILKGSLLLFLLFISFLVHGQYKAVAIKENGYTAYVDYKLKQPLYVVYKLYKGGGGCNRDENNYSFKSSDGMIGDSEYSGSGYDRGHLANAEDFGTHCEATFRYDNCLPQTVTLNRGIWKKCETNIRKESQTRHYLIVCGGTYVNAKKDHDMTIPKFCWKIVINERTHEMVYCLKFPNDNSGKVSETTVHQLQKELGYALKY